VKQVIIDCENAITVTIDKSLWGTDKDILLLACYVPPEGSPAYHGLELKDGIQILEEAVSALISDNNYYLMMFGDFNARTSCEQPNLEDMLNYSPDSEDSDDVSCRVSQDKVVNAFGRSLLNFCFMFDCLISNGCCAGDVDGDFTYVSPHGCSVIDYFILSEELLLTNLCSMKVCDRIDSWHLPVEFSLQSESRSAEAPVGDGHGEDRIVWSDDLLANFTEEILSSDFKHLLQNANATIDEDVDGSVETFAKALCSAAACMVRTIGRKKKRNQEWFDYECVQKRKLVRKLLHSFQRAKDNSKEKREKYVQERKEYKKLLKKKKDDYDQARLAKLRQSITDPKVFWQTIRSVNRRVVIYNNITTEQWYDHFFHVFNTVDDHPQNSEEVVDDNVSSDDVPMFSDAISRAEVCASIGNLKSGKSAGPDMIVSEMLKHGGDLVVDYLVNLFNRLFDSGSFPVEWSKSIIVPIHKKGDANSPDNYRGVALTSIVGKVYTHILNRRLTKWASENEKIVEEQAGFRAGYSTVDHIFSLFSIVQRFLQKNTKLYVAFVDFKKAFDLVDRNTLWHVLRRAGIHGKLYFALRGIYDTVTACVRDKSKYSQYFPCPRGVKQGCLLSPLLFSFFVNELALEISQNGRHGIQLIPGAVEVFLLLFADDVILMSNTIVGLQNQLNHLKIEADRLRLTVNLDKTNVMVFRGGGHLSAREKWLYGGEVLKVTNSYKYLGLTFTTKLSITSALSEVCRKGRRGVMEILKSLRKLNTIDPLLFWKLFDSQIEPVLTYAAEVWGLSENANQIEKVHTFAIKRFLGIPLHASNQLVYGETGRYPLYVRVYVKCIKYWMKLLSLPGSRICRQAYDMLLTQHEHGKYNWVSGVKRILTENGFGIVWLCQGVGYEQRFIHELKDRLICCFMQNWHSDIESKDKYTWYYSFKSQFEPERYLSYITNRWYRECFIRFRLRVCGFQNNRLWFLDGVHGDGLCQVCGKADEDELHFLFYCEAYNDLRQRCTTLSSVRFRPSVIDISRLLASKDDNKVKEIVKYIADAMNLRKQLMELV